MGLFDEYGGYSDPYSPTDYGSEDFYSSDLFAPANPTDSLQQDYAPSRNLFGDMASNFGRGGVDALSLLGHSLDQFGLETGLEEWAKGAEERYMFMRPDIEEAQGQEGWFKTSAMGALRSAPATLVPLGAAAAGTVLGTPVVGAAAGIGTLVGLFGMGTYNQTFRDNVEFLGEEKAHALAKEVALWEVGTEGLSDAAAVFTGGLLGAPVKGVMSTVMKGVKPTLKSIMQTGPVNFLRATGVNVGAEVGSESLNSFMQTKAQIKAGLDPGLTPTQAALASIGPSLFLSGGITLGTQGASTARRNSIVNILKSEKTTVDQKNFASQIVENTLRRENETWAENWKIVSKHILDNNGTFDINSDFVNEASRLTGQKEQVESESREQENKEIYDALYGDGQSIEEALLGGAPLQPFDPNYDITKDNAEIDRRLAEYDPITPRGATRKPTDVPITGKDFDTAAQVSRDNPFETELNSMFPDTEGLGFPMDEAVPKGDVFDTAGLEFPMNEPATAPATITPATPTQKRKVADNLKLETRILTDKYSPDLPPAVAKIFAEAQAQADMNAEMDKQTGEYEPILPDQPTPYAKLKMMLSTPESPVSIEQIKKMDISPDLYRAILQTPMKEIRENGVAAVTARMPEVEEHKAVAQTKEEIPSQKGNRTLTPQEKARLVQAAEEFDTLEDAFEQYEIDNVTPSPEEQRLYKDLEKEVSLMAGKTDEDLETIYPGLDSMYNPETIEQAQEASREAQNAVNEEIAAIQKDVSAGNKTEEEGRAESFLVQGFLDGDTAAIEGTLSDYREKNQLAVLTDTALRLRDALDKAPDTPGNREIKKRIYRTIASMSTKPVTKELPEGFVQWKKVPTTSAGKMFSAQDTETGESFFLYREPTKKGQRGGRWRILTTKTEGGYTYDTSTTDTTPEGAPITTEEGSLKRTPEEREIVGEDTILTQSRGESLDTFVKRFYRASGKGPYVRKPLVPNKRGVKKADKTGQYTTSQKGKNYWESRNGEWTIVPKSKGGTWGIIRTADFEQWWDLTDAERTAAWYKSDGKVTFEGDLKAKRIVQKELGGAVAVVPSDKLTAESQFLKDFRAQEAEGGGLEKGSKGPKAKTGKGPKTKGATEKQERLLEEDNPSGEVIVREGLEELREIALKEGRSGEYEVENLLYRLQASTAKAAKDLSDALNIVATDFVTAFKAGKTGRMAVIKEDAYGVFGYPNSKKAPKEVTEKMERFLNAAISFTYRGDGTKLDGLNKNIADLQAYKAAVRSQIKTTTLDDVTGYESDIRKANRQISTLRGRASKLSTRMDQFASSASTYWGNTAEQARTLMQTYSKRGVTVFDNKIVAPVKPRVVLAEELYREYDPGVPGGTPASLVMVPTSSDKIEKPVVTRVAKEKGHTIWKTEQGFVVEDSQGIIGEKVYKTQANAQRYVIDKIKIFPSSQMSTIPASERGHEGGNGWSPIVTKVPHLPDYLGLKTDGILKSDNGKYTATLKAPERDNPFLPDRIWEVTNNKGKVVARYRTADDVVANINGATKTGYIPKRAKATAKMFSIGESTESKPTGNTAKGIASKLTRFLGKEGTKRWTGRLTIVQSLDEASGVGTEIKGRGIDGPVLGYYNPATNSVTLVADNIAEGTEQDVFLHEGLHFVMENDGEFVRTKDALLKRIGVLKNRSGAVQDAWNEASDKNPNASEKELAEEAYAYLLQNPDNRKVGIVRQALAAIKRFLIKMRIPVGALGLTDGDLVSMATKSISNLRNVKEMDEANRSFAAGQYVPDEVRQRKMTSPKFQKFFQNSLVKERGDEGSPPIVLYNASSSPNVIPEQSTQTLGQEQDPSLMPYLGINLTNEDRAMEQADQGAVFGYYARVENPRRMTAKQLNAGISTVEDAQARKRVFEADGHDGIFIMSGTGPNAVVERVIVFNQNQIQQSEKAWRQVSQNTLKFSTADAPAAEPVGTPERSQTGEQLSAKSTLPNDGGRGHVFAPITASTPKNKEGKYRSDHVFKNNLTGKYYEYTNFNSDTQDYDVKRELSQEEYGREAERYSGEQQQLDETWYDGQPEKTKAAQVGERSNDFLKKTKKTVKDLVESISEGVRKISLPAYGKLNRMEFEIQDTIRRYGKDVAPWMKKYSEMGERDKFILDQALRNSDFRARDRVLIANDMAGEWGAVQAVLKEIKQGQLETGLIDEVQALKNYFPRAVRTGKVDDLIASMRDDDSDFATVLGDEMDKLGNTIEAEGRKMTEADRLAHIQKLLNTGHYQFIPKPGSSNDRSITSVLRKQAEFYNDSVGALEGHIYDAVQAIEYRRLLGKTNLSRPIEMKKLRALVTQIDELENNENRSEKENEQLKNLKVLNEAQSAKLEQVESDLKDSIASYVDEELGKNNPEAGELIHLIRARLTQRGTHGLWGTVRDAGYMFTLGSPMSAITQIGDLALSAYANNPLNTTVSIFSQIFSRFTGSKRMTKDYFDFSHSLGDFSKTGIENMGSQKALDKILTWSGLKGMDLFGKDVFLQSAMWKNSDMSKAEFKKKKAHLFDGDMTRAGKAWEDIKDRNFDSENRDALFVLFNDLSQWQPISLSEMPPAYNTAGNGRIFYMLKSFNIKALNSLRREVQESWVAGDRAKAVTKGMGLVMAISLAGAGADEIKDWILGKEVDFDDNFYDNLASMFMFNRFTLEKGMKQGQVFSSIVQGQMPPVRFMDNIGDDVGKFMFDRENFKFKTLGLVPVVGRIAYSRTDPGRSSELANRKRDLYEEIRENARMSQALYAGSVRERLKVYNDMAKDLGEDKLGYKQLKNIRSKERKKIREERRA